MNRRTFLKNAAYAAALAGTGALTLSRPSAGAWAQLPSGVWAPGAKPYKILEICCYGGLSQWENFWVRKDLDGGWAGYAEAVGDLPWLASAACSGTPDTPDETLGGSNGIFAEDAEGHAIAWGPATRPLWHDALLERTRLVTLRLDQSNPPHQVGLHLAMTGRAIGRPRTAGLGAAIEHRFQSLAPRGLPYSYVLSPGDIGSFWHAAVAAASKGQHTHRPLQIKLRAGEQTLKAQLPRSGISDASDALFNVYRSAYRDLLRFQGKGSPVRSAGFSAYESAAESVLAAPELDALIHENLLEVETGEPCIGFADSADFSGNTAANLDFANNSTKTALALATHLLTDGGAQHVCILDRGIVEAPGGAGAPYDVHGGGAVSVTSANLWNLLTHLVQHIALEPGDPGSIGIGGPSRLSLDDTIIVIQTEFSRTVAEQLDGGRDHHAAGFASVVIGGPTTWGISGAIDDAYTTVPSYAFRHADVHAALMLAAGIWPFAEENFVVTEDLSPAIVALAGSNDPDAVASELKRRIFGLS